MRVSVVFLASSIALAASGCGAASSSKQETVTVTTSTPVASPVQQPVTTAAMSPPQVRVAHWSDGFQSPTGNIRCELFKGVLYCETLNNHRGVVLDTVSEAVQESVVTTPRRTLPYGWRWSTA